MIFSIYCYNLQHLDQYFRGTWRTSPTPVLTESLFLRASRAGKLRPSGYLPYTLVAELETHRHFVANRLLQASVQLVSHEVAR